VLRRLVGLLGTLALAVLSGAAAVALRVPAGGMIGPLVVIGTLNVATGRVPQFPERWRRGAMILTGTVIGSGIGPHLLETLARVWPAALVMTAWIMVVGLGLGWLLSRWTGLGLSTALLCFAPGGLQEMILTAQDVGADSRLVAMVGMMRILLTVLSVPLLLGYLVVRPW
jgi:membrane AbrB-like protein